MTKPELGATASGVKGESQTAGWVQRMFAEIAPKYDLLNHLLSFNVDKRWRKSLLKQLDPVLANPEARILDLCCGTGDVTLALQARAAAQILAADFCHPMLVSAQKKALQRGRTARLFEADALLLPVAGDSFDAISIAFGFRNLANYARGLEELWRVIRPGGILAILEFSHPRGALTNVAYGFYSRCVLPLIGQLISGSHEAYSYLPDSIAKFPQAQELEQMMRQAGFVQTRFQLLSGGIAALHTGIKA
ncbi:MAG: bifunctional demethylmenaquinone methyltransferase/2-methoxy-6-polyprenyl-1,4-benzoquinol methylase UbiE [Acidobacteriota bacterium]|nr:bifunctional demethylmenaquinone methyltransferase/2-methoxy-6-polyprenyl-1,4-benzoquinol methylase UbiE [Acidobacteriota bacterium]